MELLTAAIGTVAGILTVAFGIPQAIRILKSRSTEGVSPAAWWLTYILCLTWLAYGLQINDWVLILSNAASLLAPGVILISSRPREVTFTVFKIVGVTVGGLIICMGVPQAIAGFIAAALLSTTRIPQVVASFNAMKAHRVTVVSSMTWTISLTFSALWVIYGVLNNDWAQIVGNVIATALSLLVLTFEIVSARRITGKQVEQSSSKPSAAGE